MFKSIKRFFHNLFWKEKRIVKEDPKRSNFVGLQQEPTKTLVLPEEIRQLKEAVPNADLAGYRLQEEEPFPANQAAYEMAAALKGSALTQEEKKEIDKELPHILAGNFALTGDLPDTFKGWASPDKNSQPTGRVSSDRLYQNRKRQLISPILEDEAGDETYALKATPIMSQLEEFHEPNRGLARGQLHILTAHTDPSKSVFHSGNSLQNEVNHLIAIDPTKFCSEDHAEVDMVVKKLGDEVDCRITKVKVVKRRLKPLSKNETSKMSKRRVKKESKKVLEVSRGKHRG